MLTTEVASYVTTYSTGSSVHSTIQSAADNRESQESSKEGGCAPAITQRDSLHWSVIVQPFLPPESHQCYATSTPIGNEAARVRHLKWGSESVAPSGGGVQHSHCLTWNVSLSLSYLSSHLLSHSHVPRPRCSISSPSAIASQRVPLSRPDSRWLTVSCSWIAILVLHYLSLHIYKRCAMIFST